MRLRPAPLILSAALAACNAPPPEPPPAPRPTAKQAPALSEQQIRDLSGQCEAASREQFRKEWKDGRVATPEGRRSATFSSHYNAKMDTCFYLVTVDHFGRADGRPGEVADRRSRSLLAIGHAGQYGEYLGPADAASPKDNLPATCRIDAFYCSSEGEWKILAEPFMKD